MLQHHSTDITRLQFSGTQVDERGPSLRRRSAFPQLPHRTVQSVRDAVGVDRVLLEKPTVEPPRHLWAVSILHCPVRC
jgi:hypothetical protein